MKWFERNVSQPLLVGLYCAAMASVGCGSSKLPAPVTPKKAIESRITEAQRIACKDRFSPKMRTSAEIAEPAEENTVARVAHIANLLRQARECAEKGLVDEDGYREFLLANQSEMAAWYSRLPRLFGAALSNDASTSETVTTGDKTERVPVNGVPELAEAYLITREELTRLALKHRRDKATLDADLQAQSLVHALMHVDSLSLVIAERLPRNPKDKLEPSLQGRLKALGPALEHEAQRWATDVIAVRGMNVGDAATEQGKSPLPPGAPQFHDRFLQVSKNIKTLADKWKERNLDDEREYIGKGYQRYLRILHDAERKLLADGRQSREQSLPWAAALEALFGNATEKSPGREGTLSRITREIAFDKLNLSGSFAMHDARGNWWELLRADRARIPASAEIIGRARDLLDAANRTEGAADRLDGLSRIINVTNLETGDAFSASKSDSKNDAELNKELKLFRQRASRQLSEAALCEMNRALFGHSPAPCRIALQAVPAAPTLSADQCNPPAISKEIEPDQGIPLMLPEPTSRAYMRIVASLNVNWTVKPDPKESDPDIMPLAEVSSQGKCELLRLFQADTLSRLSMTLRGYEHLLRMAADGRIEPPMNHLADVMSQGIEVALAEQKSLCERIDSNSCSVDPFIAAMENNTAGQPGDPPEAKKKKDTAHTARAHEYRQFCNTMHAAKSMYESMIRPGEAGRGGQSLLVRARKELGAAREDVIRARGGDFVAQSKACSAHDAAR